jgi:transposase
VLVKTLLNRVEKFKSFVYTSVRAEGGNIVVEIEPRKGSRPVCSKCGERRPCHDLQPAARRFQYVPLWNIPVFFVYRMRRADCPECGVRVESVPWARGKRRITRTFEVFLARWARILSWKATADAFATSWDTVYRAVKWIVAYGLERRSLKGIEAIGVDEFYCGRSQGYITLVYEIGEASRRLLHVAPRRTVRSLLSFFRVIGKEDAAGIRFVCTDMWAAYLKVIKKKLPDALHILDRFHLVANINKAIDKIRASEARRLFAEGFLMLKHTKYCFLKNPENLTDKQFAKLNDIVHYDLKTVRAWLLKESFQLLWAYKSPHWARWYLRKWCARAMRSRLDPIKTFARSLRKHEDLIINWFTARKAYSSGIVEGLNRRINLTTRKAYGFRSPEVMKVALYHELGKLPEPKLTHRFC